MSIDPLTQDELLAVLLEAERGQAPETEPGLTTEELQRLTGLSRLSIRRRLATLLREGRITVTRVRRQSIDGRLFLVPAYRLSSRRS